MAPSSTMPLPWSTTAPRLCVGLMQVAVITAANGAIVGTVSNAETAQFICEAANATAALVPEIARTGSEAAS